MNSALKIMKQRIARLSREEAVELVRDGKAAEWIRENCNIMNDEQLVTIGCRYVAKRIHESSTES